MKIYENLAAREWRTERPLDARPLHRTMPGYAATRLVDLPALARELGVTSVHVKEENARFGLPAFKALGASYAIARALADRAGADVPLSFEDVVRLARQSGTPTLVTATDGNHGRAVAHIAAMLGLQADVLVPTAISEAAKQAIRDEGARVTELDLPYDDVVATAARHAELTGGLLVQDTAWQGYEQIPQWIVDGYGTLFTEVDEQLAGAGPDLVVIPVGVGSFAQAAVEHYRSGASAPEILCVEPEAAPALVSSLLAGHSVQVDTGTTIMAGLNCGTPSWGAWPILASGVDHSITITDAQARQAVSDLRRLGVDSGPCGASTLAGLRALHTSQPLDPTTRVLLVSTEGRRANPLPAVPLDLPTHDAVPESLATH